MSNASDKNEAVDVVVVTTHKIACDGGGGALGHPKTWLDMGQDSQVACKYCDKIFALAPGTNTAEH